MELEDYKELVNGAGFLAAEAKEFGQTETRIAINIADFATEYARHANESALSAEFQRGVDRAAADFNKDREHYENSIGTLADSLDKLARTYARTTRKEWKRYLDKSDGKILPVIRQFRQETGCGLRTAKEIIEAIRDDQPIRDFEH